MVDIKLLIYMALSTDLLSRREVVDHYLLAIPPSSLSGKLERIVKKYLEAKRSLAPKDFLAYQASHQVTYLTVSGFYCLQQLPEDPHRDQILALHGRFRPGYEEGYADLFVIGLCFHLFQLNDPERRLFNLILSLLQGLSPESEWDWMTAPKPDPEKASLAYKMLSQSFQAVKEGQNPLIYALEAKLPELFMAHLMMGADIHVRGRNGDSLLHKAVMLGQFEIVQDLIVAGLSLEALNDCGENVLHYACFSKNPKMVQWFLDGGLDPNSRTAEGITPLIAALYAKDIVSMQILIDYRADVHIWTYQERESLLHIAACLGYLPAIQLLIRAGVGIDQQNRYKQTALHLATLYQHPEVVAYLIDAGANEHLVDEEHLTPYMLARIKVMSKEIEGLFHPHPDEKIALHAQMLAHACSLGGSIELGLIPSYPLEGAYNPWIAERWYKEILKADPLFESEGIPESIRLDLKEAFRTMIHPRSTSSSELMKKIQSGRLVIIPVTHNEHAITLTFYNRYLVYCNRGGSVHFGKSLKAYKIDLAKLNLELVSKLLACTRQAHNPLVPDPDRFLYSELPMALAISPKSMGYDLHPGCALIESFDLKFQKVGNCTYASIEGAFRVALVLLGASNPYRLSKKMSIWMIRSLLAERREIQKMYPGYKPTSDCYYLYQEAQAKLMGKERKLKLRREDPSTSSLEDFLTRYGHRSFAEYES